MNKGTAGIAMAAAILVTAIVGVVIVDDVAAVTWTDTAVLNESLGTVTNGSTDTLANTCLTAAPTSVYDWTNGTEIDASNYTMSPGSYPNRGTNTITWAAANFLHNGTTVGVNYTYECNYLSDSTSRIVMEYLAVLVGAALLALAGAWLWLKP